MWWPRTSLQWAQILVALIFAAGTLGYRVIEEATWWDAFFMTVITVTTVGFSEEIPLSEVGEMFTAALLFAGFGILFFAATEVSRSVVEGELREFLGRVRRSRMIQRMGGHEVVCGYGRMGRAVVDELRRVGRDVVVVDRNPEKLRELKQLGVPSIVGDATSEEVLTHAHVQQARGLVACLNDDAHNVYTVITARSLHPSVDGTELQLDQASLGTESPLAGRTVRDAEISGRWGLSLVAIQRGTEVTPSPDAGFVLAPRDVLVIFGRRDQIAKLDLYCGRTV